MKYKFDSEYKIEICANCPCMKYDFVNKTNSCGINNMMLGDTEYKDYNCPLKPVELSTEELANIVLEILTKINNKINQKEK
jgi:hypothetical protein